MSKIKMRCNTCGKWFQSANAKELTCPECMQKARKEKAAAKNAPPTANTPAGGTVPRPIVPPPPPKPKAVQGGTNHWLDTVSDVKIGQPDQPRPKPVIPPTPREPRAEGDRRDGNLQGSPGPGNYRDRDQRGPNTREGGNRGPGGAGNNRDNDYHGPAAYRVNGTAGLSGTLGQRPRQPMEGTPPRGPRPEGRDGRYDKPRPGGGGKPGGYKAKTQTPKPPAPPKPKKEKTPPPEPFKPTDEQIKQVEERYTELATPTEFDGIRTQIAKELSIPKTAVKKIVKDFRDRQQIPSWWELQTYKGSEEELARIKAAYEPLIATPEVGVHKKIAEQLELKPGVVYQAIKLIRLELQLPQYNDPAIHGLPPNKKPTEATPEPEGAASEVVPSAESPEPVDEVAHMAEVAEPAQAPQPAVEVAESAQAPQPTAAVVEPAQAPEPADEVIQTEEKVATPVGVEADTKE